MLMPMLMLMLMLQLMLMLRPKFCKTVSDRWLV